MPRSCSDDHGGAHDRCRVYDDCGSSPLRHLLSNTRGSARWLRTFHCDGMAATMLAQSTRSPDQYDAEFSNLGELARQSSVLVLPFGRSWKARFALTECTNTEPSMRCGLQVGG